MTRPRFQAVLFDLDGTLIDSIRLILDSFHHTFTRFGIPLRSDAEWLAGIGTPLLKVLAPYASDEVPLDTLIDAYRAYNLEHHDARVAAYPGASEAVRALAGAGVRLGVVTSKNQAGTARGLRVAGIEDLMKVRICSEDVQNPKPHPEPVERAMERLGVEASETIFVGDSLHDMHAGRAAQVTTGAALWGPFRRADLTPSDPSIWLDSPDDLVRLVLG
ncbi:MAG: HAD-IA family hydrolase [Byssovorax sp.]